MKNRFQLWLKMKSGIMFLADVVKATNFVREIIVCFRNNFRLRIIPVDPAGGHRYQVSTKPCEARDIWSRRTAQ